MTRLSHFYDIDSADQLFRLLQRVAEDFSSMRGKRTQDLLLLVFGLTHLREWIAPDHDSRRLPQTPEDAFYEEIFKLEEFNILRLLCIRSKHMSQTVGVMGTLYGSRIDDSPDIDSIADFDRGAPIAYSVDERDMEDVIQTVIKFYEERWFRNHSTAA